MYGSSPHIDGTLCQLDGLCSPHEFVAKLISVLCGRLNISFRIVYERCLHIRLDVSFEICNLGVLAVYTIFLWSMTASSAPGTHFHEIDITHLCLTRSYHSGTSKLISGLRSVRSDVHTGVSDSLSSDYNPMSELFAKSWICSAQWFGIVCSTWVFMSRATTGRSEMFVLGNTSSEKVVIGNAMVPQPHFSRTQLPQRGPTQF